MTASLCRCHHGKSAHPASEDDACLVPDCLCVEFEPADLLSIEHTPVVVAEAPMATRTLGPAKRCIACKQTKPLDEFYLRSKGGRRRINKCRDCDNAKPRRRNTSKIIRVRARHRATAELVKRYDDEFRELLDYFTTICEEEAAILASASSDPEAIFLRAGSRRDGQDVVDRIDVARCPECVTHHDRGHVCANCGAAPTHSERTAS